MTGPIVELNSTWVRPRPTEQGLRRDIVLACVLAAWSALTVPLYLRSGIFTEVAPMWLTLASLAIMFTASALRRRIPCTVALIITAAFLVNAHFGVPEQLVTSLCLSIALYTVGAWGRQRVRALVVRLVCTAAIVIWCVVWLILASSNVGLFPGISRAGVFSAYATVILITVMTNLLNLTLACAVGEASWQWARTRARLEAQGGELERERRTTATQAVVLERLAIARELHDVVAHHISVIGIHAGAARLNLTSDPSKIGPALEHIEEGTSAVVTELRRLVHTLRDPSNGEDGPTVGIAQIPSLVEEAAHIGMDVTTVVVGEPRPVPMLVDVALYRVAQEALTNVRKHAPKRSRVQVIVRFASDAVEVEVVDTSRAMIADRRGRPAHSASTSTGMGLRGMRERIGAVGGTVEAHPGQYSGFVVRAHVPLMKSTGDRDPSTVARQEMA